MQKDPRDATKSLAPTPDATTVPLSYLLVIDGSSSSKRVLPEDGVVLVGRAPDADLRIDSASFSRRHAKLIVVGGAVSVADLGSHNGTCVNGERIEGARSLSSGDVITVGDVALVLRCEGRTHARAVVDAAGLRQRLTDEVERALDFGRPLTVLAISLGDPAREWSHVGTRALSEVRPSSTLGWGGSAQLVALLPELDGAGARAAAAHLLERIAALAPEAKGGIACCPADGCDADTLLSGARAAATAAKRGEVAAAAETAVHYPIGKRTVVAADPAMIRLFDLIRRLAAHDLPVLILGETGAGKEIAAAALHHWSPRADKPMVAINCAAIPITLVESELFGHEKGAFSDARTTKIGRLEAANGGTVFLDEIAELPEQVQAKLLRVLEEKRFTRLGEVRERELDVRIVAATNRDLKQDSRLGRFRQDLFYRLNAAPVNLPPLRHRRREIPILARMFLADACVRAGQPTARLSDATLERLTTYAWPGNVRELRNAMDFVAATATGGQVEPHDLPGDVACEDDPEAARPSATPPEQAAPQFRPLADELRDFELSRIEAALAAGGGVQTRAARLLHVPLRTFVYKLRQHGLTAKETKRRP